MLSSFAALSSPSLSSLLAQAQALLNFLALHRYWFGKTISHTIQVTYGISGSFSYSAYSDGNLRRPLITYQATGDMGSSASLKYGNYRAAVSGISEATAYVGDLVQTRLS